MTRFPTAGTMILKPRDIFGHLVYPIRATTAHVAILTFFLLVELALFAGVLGLFLLLLVAPAISRYLMLVLETRSHGHDVDPPTIELFGWFSAAWSVFPLLLAVAVAMLSAFLVSRAGWGAGAAVGAIAVVSLPASLGVLAISHSPAQSIDPRRLLALIGRCGAGYAVLPGSVVAAGLLFVVLRMLGVPEFLLRLFAWYFLFGFFSLIGAVLRAYRLADDLSIPDPIEPDAAEPGGTLIRNRNSVLTHAYGFVSRGNRRGGLKHVLDWLMTDPLPETAWPWFFEQMTTWEDADAALEFAQHYLGRLLQSGEQLAAVKLLLRCRGINPRFRPLPEDTEAAVVAALQCDNDDLARFLRS